MARQVAPRAGAWIERLNAELNGKDVRTINEHLQNLYKERELDAGATIRKFRIVRMEGEREVGRLIDHYSLEAILAVGYRVRSARGLQFRQGPSGWQSTWRKGSLWTMSG